MCEVLMNKEVDRTLQFSPLTNTTVCFQQLPIISSKSENFYCYFKGKEYTSVTKEEPVYGSSCKLVKPVVDT